jgi:hypothetical protein
MGAFCSSASPTAVRAEVTDVQYSDTDAEFEIDYQAIDHRSFQVLRQMLSGLRTEGFDVLDVTVVSPGLDFGFAIHASAFLGSIRGR